MNIFQRAALLGAGVMMIGGCTEPNPGYWGGEPQLPGECRAGEETLEIFEDFERPDQVDLLLLVANSGEISRYQEALSVALPIFLEDLEAADLDVRVAVMTTDADGDPGLARAVSTGEECRGNSTVVARSGETDWVKAASCNVLQGSDGSARQQPLAKLHEALVEDASLLEGFRRERARFVALVLTNQDDCSGGSWQERASGSVRDQCVWRAGDLREVSSYAAAIKQQFQTPEGFSFAVISGPDVAIDYDEGTAVRPVCSSTLGSAYPSGRLLQAAQAFGSEGLFLSSCVLDLHGHLERIKEEVLLREHVTICPAQPMAHEPLEVRGEFEDGEVRDLSFGTGFVLQGPGESCQNSAIQLQRGGISSLKQLELRYCARP